MIPREIARSGIIFSVWLMTSCAVTGSDAPIWKDTSALIKEIEQRSASQVVRDVWKDREGWSHIMNQVASGQPEWIAVALRLRAGLDAGASAEMHDAMFQALRRNPAYILEYAEPAYPLDTLCQGRVDPLPTYQEASNELGETMAAVQRVRDEKLELNKKRCIAKLKEGEGHLKRFYGS